MSLRFENIFFVHIYIPLKSSNPIQSNEECKYFCYLYTFVPNIIFVVVCVWTNNCYLVLFVYKLFYFYEMG